MSDSQNDGGTQWELKTAGEQMIAARRANDPEAEVLALIRFADGLRNSSIGVVGAVMSPLDAQIKALASVVTNSVSTQDQRFGYVLLQLGAFLEKEDTRHDAYSGELQAIVDGLGGLRADVQNAAVETARRLGKHTEDIESLQHVVAEHSDQLAALHMDHEERITSLEDYRAEMQSIRDALAELSARIGGALPTEEDQELSAQLRADAKQTDEPDG